MNKNEVPKDEEREKIDILKIKEVKEFAEGVSIAGMEEAFGAKTKVERLIWKICVVIVLMLMVVESVAIGVRYKFDDDNMFSDLELVGRRPEFPSISICVPKMANKSRFEEIMVIPQDAWDLMKKTNLTVQQVVDFAGTISASDVSAKGDKASLVFVAEKVNDATYKSMPHPFSDLIQTTSSPCPDILSNCAMDGMPFDCCSAAKFSFMEHAHCYYIEANTAKQLRSSHAKANIDQTVSDVEILQVNVSTHWEIVQFLDGVSSAGYYVHIGQASPLGDPVLVPTDMEATIVLAPARRLHQLTGCTPVNGAPSLAPYFDTYDQDGSNCAASTMLEYFSKQALCMAPLLTFSPSNQTSCNARLMLASTAAIRGDMFGDILHSHWSGASVDAIEKKLFDKAKGEFKKGSCTPLCSRWSYRVLSASYTSIVQKNRFNVDDKANISWTRIKVLLPSSSYFIHEERSGNIVYVAVCEIGGCMGVFAGFSMVTIIELIFYGPRICCALARKRKHRVLTVPAARMVAPTACSGGKCMRSVLVFKH